MAWPARLPLTPLPAVEKAMDPHGDVLLAFEMNGAPLPPDVNTVANSWGSKRSCGVQGGVGTGWTGSTT